MSVSAAPRAPASRRTRRATPGRPCPTACGRSRCAPRARRVEGGSSSPAVAQYLAHDHENVLLGALDETAVPRAAAARGAGAGTPSTTPADAGEARARGARAPRSRSRRASRCARAWSPRPEPSRPGADRAGAEVSPGARDERVRLEVDRAEPARLGERVVDHRGGRAGDRGAAGTRPRRSGSRRGSTATTCATGCRAPRRTAPRRRRSDRPRAARCRRRDSASPSRPRSPKRRHSSSDRSVPGHRLREVAETQLDHRDVVHDDALEPRVADLRDAVRARAGRRCARPRSARASAGDRPRPTIAAISSADRAAAGEHVARGVDGLRAPVEAAEAARGPRRGRGGPRREGARRAPRSRTARPL